MYVFYCIHSSSCSKDDLSFKQFWKAINLTRILERYKGRVGEGSLRTRMSNVAFSFFLQGFLTLFVCEVVV